MKGRQIERFDSGFSTSTGYYQMEAAHSHPVVLTFCALLYHNRLMGKRSDVYAYDLIQLAKNKKQQVRPIEHKETEESEKRNEQKKSISIVSEQKSQKAVSIKGKKLKKENNQKIVNRWLVAVTLIHNFSLVAYRKNTSSHQKIKLF